MIVLSRRNSEKMYQRPGWALIAAICARSPVRSGGQAQAAISPSSGAVISEAAAAARGSCWRSIGEFLPVDVW